MREVVADPKGHCLAVGDVEGGPCMLCVACGAWCRLRPVLLLEPCRGRAGRVAAGAEALKRFKQGYLPSDHAREQWKRVDGVYPFSAKAIAHWDSWREPARHELASWRRAATAEQVSAMRGRSEASAADASGGEDGARSQLEPIPSNANLSAEGRARSAPVRTFSEKVAWFKSLQHCS